MKMRKITSFVLTLALVLGSFSMAFAAAPATSAGLTDIAGVANEEAIQVCYDLGIIEGYPDGTFLPTKAVNRAEFAAMMTRALKVPASALAGYTSTTFKDTVGYGWAVPYLAFCQSKGIMIGDGFGNVMPGRTINVNEAMTMVLRVVGYTENSSMLVGTWPSKYVTVAQNLGLYDDVAATVNVDRASAAQIIYNTLTVQKVAVNSDGETIYLWDDAAKTIPATLLNTGLGADSATISAVGTDGYTWNINYFTYLGEKGTVYLNSDDEVIAFVSDSTVKTGSINSDGKLVVGDTKYEVKAPLTTSTAVNVIKNTETITPASIASFAGIENVKIAGDFSGKYITAVDAVVVWDASYDESTTGIVDATDLGDIADNEFMGATFVEDDNGNIDTTSFILEGVASLDKIAKGDVAYVYTNADGDIVKIAIGNKEVTGKVTEYNTGTDEFVVAGNTYMNADQAKVLGVTNEGSVVSTDVSNDVTLYLDAYGFVYDVDSTTVTDKYAIATGDDSAFTKQSRIYTADADDEVVFSFTTAAYATVAGLDAGDLFAYGLDKDGKINAMDTTVVTGQYAQLSGTRSLKVATTTSGIATGTPYAISADVVVFTANTGLVDGFALSDIAEINTTAVTGITYVLDGNKIVAMIVDKAVATKTVSDAYGVVNSSITKYNATEDDTFSYLTGFVGTTSFAKYSDVDVSGLNLFKFTYDSKDFVKTAAVQTSVTALGATVDVGTNSTLITYTGGTATIQKDAVVYRYDTTATNDYAVSSLGNIEGTVYLYDTDTDVDGYDIVIFIK